MERKICSRCRKRTDAYVRTLYGEICSIKCFRKLCDNTLGANEDDFIVEESNKNETCSICGSANTKFVEDVGYCVEIWYCEDCKEDFEA